VQISLGAFNYWNQSILTQSYIELALQALPRIKRERKIFFLVAWLDAFIGGQRARNRARLCTIISIQRRLSPTRG
jgi:aminopeptidase N